MAPMCGCVLVFVYVHIWAGVRGCVGVYMSMHWCVQKCWVVCECVWDKFSEYLLENRILTSVDSNMQYPIRIFFKKYEQKLKSFLRQSLYLAFCRCYKHLPTITVVNIVNNHAQEIWEFSAPAPAPLPVHNFLCLYIIQLNLLEESDSNTMLIHTFIYSSK